MVVADIFGHEALEMTFVEHDDMIEQVSPATADEAFRNAILPRAAEAGPLGLDSETLDRADTLLIEVGCAVEDQIFRGRVVGKGLAQLLGDPFTARMPGDAEAENAPPIMRYHEETVEHPKRECRYREEVHRSNRLAVVAEERRPSSGRLRIPRGLPHPAQHGSLGDREAEHPQLAMNPRCSPRPVLGHHTKDQVP